MILVVIEETSREPEFEIVRMLRGCTEFPIHQSNCILNADPGGPCGVSVSPILELEP